ncbi:substrate-binding periplasmic protein [Chromobacterium sphagni]|uniref:ABC transporter substrate-binding protein n=1 Tax=Chromobacterium sphagni TaxID=1903179 RepID=A0A1S1WY10_9NEIS|nr:ABC transporter substrate-binding protein [Chromobacterium sphagni]OHX12181.1 ABC transporter substrate-binding protein [Chromobacterium sphagni]OHX21734.1 ABC transporter substrate-binding protein [Chromobacterium sphagni]
MASLHKKWLLPCLLLASTSAWAATSLRIGVADTDAPPIAVLSEDGNTLTGGLARDLGLLLAEEINLKPQFVLLARRRVEPSIESGKVDIICNANPDWFPNSSRLGWTHEIYPLVERVLSLKGQPPIRQLDDLAGKNIGTLHGYHYPTLEYLWASNRSQRQTEARFDLLFKSLEKHLSDVAIVTELTYVWWTRGHAQEAAAFKVHPLLVSSQPTMCALSPQSPLKLDELNRAIDRLHKSGKLKTLMSRYQWQE